ncbi:hypothetical protein EZV73_01500 [Acidaminobacter sp. JC074]|uniref:hypothetical protein n=1 Tax=Acidaminobacter sp. JC074 TaxID=2530199 RepID=UPI001F0D5886|nr:hypothetical protein [Acidaminobacter sp. JC074]MCH4886219.1 hypothetical protein [Acidaminobacter sp. JC074]
MKKTLFILLLVVLMTLTSCEVVSRLRTKEFEAYLEDFQERYTLIEDYEIMKAQSGIFVYLYFTSYADIEFDENMYKDIETFISNPENYKKILDDYGKHYSLENYYPSITVYFSDRLEIESHDIEADGYEARKDVHYDRWTKPYFFNKGYYTTPDKATEEVLAKRSKAYPHIEEVILGEDRFNFVSIIYNYASLRDEHVVLNITFSSDEDDKEALISYLEDAFDKEYNLVVSYLGWESLLNYKKVTFLYDDNHADKYVFSIQKEDVGLVDNDFYLLKKDKLFKDMSLNVGRDYSLTFEFYDNQLVSYSLEEVK